MKEDNNNPQDDQHEAKCRRCGRCCFEKVIVGDEVILTPMPCEHLDLATCLCRVYAERHELQLRCLSVQDGIKARAFPADCPYVQGIDGYRPPQESAGLDESDWFLEAEEHQDSYLEEGKEGEDEDEC